MKLESRPGWDHAGLCGPWEVSVLILRVRWSHEGFYAKEAICYREEKRTEQRGKELRWIWCGKISWWELRRWWEFMGSREVGCFTDVLWSLVCLNEQREVPVPGLRTKGSEPTILYVSVPGTMVWDEDFNSGAMAERLITEPLWGWDCPGYIEEEKT